jgi:hypothetical protein
MLTFSLSSFACISENEINEAGDQVTAVMGEEAPSLYLPSCKSQILVAARENAKFSMQTGEVGVKAIYKAKKDESFLAELVQVPLKKTQSLSIIVSDGTMEIILINK